MEPILLKCSPRATQEAHKERAQGKGNGTALYSTVLHLIVINTLVVLFYDAGGAYQVHSWYTVLCA